MAKTDFVVISQPTEITSKRTEEIRQEFDYKVKTFSDIDRYVEDSFQVAEIPFVVLSAVNMPGESEIMGSVQVIRQVSKEAFIVAILSSKMTHDQTVFIKKSGANLVLLEIELSDSSKLEFIIGQRVKRSYFSIKTVELITGTKFEAYLYHFMPLNQKFLTVVFAGQEISGEKISKLSLIEEVYIKREDIGAYQKYVEDQEQGSGQALFSRCRSQFLTLCSAYIDLVFLILDKSEGASFEKGRSLYDRCESLAKDLVKSLAVIENPWSLVQQTAIGDQGSIERGPAIAAYAGLLAVQSGEDSVIEVMVAALLADIGMADIDPKVTRTLRSHGNLNWVSGQKEDYERHPLISLNRVLSHRIGLNDSIKEAILRSHERADTNGFPNKVPKEKIPVAAMIIQLAEQIDLLTFAKPGVAQPDIKIVIEELLSAELIQGRRYDLKLLEKLKKTFNR